MAFNTWPALRTPEWSRPIEVLPSNSDIYFHWVLRLHGRSVVKRVGEGRYEDVLNGNLINAMVAADVIIDTGEHTMSSA